MTGSFPPRSGVADKAVAGSIIGRKLQRARHELAATEDFVASALGLTVDAYRAIEGGAARLSPGGVIQAARLFGLPPSALCADDNDGRTMPRSNAEVAAVIDLAAVRRSRKG